MKNRFSILSDDAPVEMSEEEEEEIEREYSCLKESIQHTNKTAPTVDRIPKKPWISAEILQLMDDRKAVKGRDDKKYTDLDHQIKRKCQKAKEEYFEDHCAVIEKLHSENKTMNLHR